MTSSMKNQALFYVKGEGNMPPLSILPLKGKIPAIPGGHGAKGASNSADQVEKWWTDRPNANIGIATGEVNGIVVIDVDVDNEKGLDGAITLASAEKEYGKLPDTWTVNTPRGGYHLYFKYPAGKAISIGTDIFNNTHGPGIDYRGNGGLVVAPPSMHPDVKKRYEWDVERNPRTMGIADLPEKWVSILAKSEKDMSERFILPDIIDDGSRNKTLFHYACSLRGKGEKASIIMDSLKHVNATQCRPPVDDEELQSIFDSAMGYDSGKSDKTSSPAELNLICFSDVQE